MQKGFCGLLLLPLISVFAHAGDRLPETAGDAALVIAEKALPWIQEEGQWWIEKKECVSCHHTSFGIWAGTLASEYGLPFPESLLEEWRQFAWQHQLSPREKKESTDPDEKIGERNIEGLSQLLLNGSEPLSEEAVKQFREMIVSQQKEMGHWTPYGQLPRQIRPQEETTAVSTMWAALALKDGEAEEQAREWLTKSEKSIEPVSTEWFAFNLLLKGSGEALEKLMGRQNEDGGWSWMDGEKSDPMATGQALMAIGRMGKQADFPAEIQRAVEFLEAGQNDEGYWKTNSTKDPGEQTRISNFWGTTWAVIGLLESRAPRITVSSAP